MNAARNPKPVMTVVDQDSMLKRQSTGFSIFARNAPAHVQVAIDVVPVRKTKCAVVSYYHLLFASRRNAPVYRFKSIGQHLICELDSI